MTGLGKKASEREKIIALREKLGWTQVQLATKAKVAPSTLSRFEQGGKANRNTVDRLMEAIEKAGANGATEAPQKKMLTLIVVDEAGKRVASLGRFEPSEELLNLLVPRQVSNLRAALVPRQQSGEGAP